MVALKYIEYVLFALLYGTSLFAYSNAMTDTFIVGKWCYTLLVLTVCLFIVAIIRFCFPSSSGWGKQHDKTVVFLCCMIVFISFCQTLYGLGQWLHCFPSNGRYRMTGSFDNPAGFAASLVAVFPFILYCRKSMTVFAVRCILSLVALLTILAILLSCSRSGLTAVVVGYFTENDLSQFKNNSEYGYMFDFATNGDGSGISVNEDEIITSFPIIFSK